MLLSGRSRLQLSPLFAFVGFGLALGITVVLFVLSRVDRFFAIGQTKMSELAYLPSLPAPLHYEKVAWWSSLKTVDKLAVFNEGFFKIDAETHSTFIHVTATSPGFFEVFRTKLLFGRHLSQRDYMDGGAVAVVSSRLWRRLRQTDGVQRKYISINARKLTIVGAVDNQFRFPKDSDIWLSSALFHQLSSPYITQTENGGWVAHLSAGRTVRDLSVEANQRLAVLNTKYSAGNKIRYGEFITVKPFDHLIAPSTSYSALSLGCCTILSLSLVYLIFTLFDSSAGDTRDRHTQVVLGASARHLAITRIRALLLPMIAGMLTLFLTSIFAWIYVSHSSRSDWSAVSEIVDSRTYIFALLILVIEPLICVIIQAYIAYRACRAFGKARSSMPLLPGRWAGRWSLTAVVEMLFLLCQSAATYILLALAIHSLRTLDQITSHLNHGITSSGLLMVTANRPAITSSTQFGRKNVLQSRSPTDTAFAYTDRFQPLGDLAKRYFWFGNESHAAFISSVSPNYFSVVGTTFLSGRTFSQEEQGSVVISEGIFSRSHGSPLGAFITFDGDARPYRIIGVVKNTGTGTSGKGEGPVRFQIYLQFPQSAAGNTVRILLRSSDTTASGVSAFCALGNTAGQISEMVGPIVHVGDRLAHLDISSNIKGRLWMFYGLVSLLVTLLGIASVTVSHWQVWSGPLAIHLVLGATVSDLLFLLASRTWYSCVSGTVLGVTAWLSLESFVEGSPTASGARTDVLLAFVVLVLTLSSVLMSAKTAIQKDLYAPIRHL